MHTFLFIATPDERFAQTDLAVYARLMKKWMPALNVELDEGHTFLPECKYGWFWLAPAAHETGSLISEVITHQYAVLVFGDIFNTGSLTAAQIVGEAWLAGGAPRVKQLDGCFSAVIINRTTREVVLIGDMMGRRRLSYYVSGQTLLVSPHDVTLMATGHVPVEFDWISVGSVVGLEWALGGKSLLKHVQTCHPTECLRWHQGRIKKHFDPVIDASQRIPQGDVKGINSHLNHMIEIGQEQARIFVGNRSEIRCDLSAGFDSRVVWSLLLSVIDKPAQILSVSAGEAHCLDVEVAKELAAMYGTSFFSVADPPPSPDEFVTRCDLLAFAMNGGTPGKRAMKYPTEFTSHPQTYACGNGGEIYRGYYYPHYPPVPRTHLTSDDALDILKKKSRIGKLPWKTRDLGSAVQSRLTATMEEYAGFSEDGYDILDMFYLYERMGVWGSATARQTWKDPRWSPFMSSQIIRMAFRMPAPIAHFAMIHRETLRRLAPKAYRVPINDNELLPLDDWGPISPLLKAIDKTYKRNLNRARRILNLCQPWRQTRNMEQVAADTLSGVLMKIIGDILLSNGSFSLEIFGQHGIELLLNEHKQGKKDHTEVLGLMVAMERWRSLVRGVAADASRNCLESRGYTFK